MKTKLWKYTALAVSGGVLLQWAGCAAALGDTLIQGGISLLINVILAALTGSTGTTS